MRFCHHLSKNVQDLKMHCHAKPEAPEMLPTAVETFKAMAYGTDPLLWLPGNLRQVFRYLRGGKNLAIPSEWRDLIPSSFPADSEGTG